MMPAAARKGDSDSSDGSIVSDVSDDVIINGQPAAVLGSIDSPHSPWGSAHPPHEAATISLASSSVIVNGKGLAYVGSNLTCGHVISAGSPDVDTAA